jgi:hypothetical protein
MQHNAFVVPGDPSSDKFTVRDVSLPNGLTAARLDRRRQALAKIDTLQRQLDEQPEALQATDAYYQSAFNMITSAATKTAFDLGQEDQKTRDAYGSHNLGQSCLLARRMIEAGCRFVTVTSGGWDTHRDNFNGLKKLLPPLDQAWPALLADLEDRGPGVRSWARRTKLEPDQSARSTTRPTSPRRSTRSWASRSTRTTSPPMAVQTACVLAIRSRNLVDSDEAIYGRANRLNLAGRIASMPASQACPHRLVAQDTGFSGPVGA